MYKLVEWKTAQCTDNESETRIAKKTAAPTLEDVTFDRTKKQQKVKERVVLRLSL